MSQNISSKVFADRTLVSRISLLANVILLLALLFQPVFQRQREKVKERFIILSNDGTYVVAPSLEFQEASAIHEKSAHDILNAVFMRNPRGPDRPKELDRLFDDSTRKKVEEFLTGEEHYFAQNEVHQKIESLKIDIQRITDTKVRINAEVQLIRNGKFSNNAIVEARHASVYIELERNPNIYINDKYPLFGCDFQVTYQ